MGKIPEVTLNLKTKKVPPNDSYSIDDMERMFGKRIKKAINTDVDSSGRMYKGIITKEMAKICKPWKFWNRDIRRAYKRYTGIMIVPWIIVETPPVIDYISPETEEYLKKQIDFNKYAEKYMGNCFNMSEHITDNSSKQ